MRLVGIVENGKREPQTLKEPQGMPRTIRDLIFSQGQPDSFPAILGAAGGAMDYGRLRHQVTAIGGGFCRAGFQKADRIGVVLPNGPLLASAILSVSASHVCAPINPNYQEAEFGHALKRLKVKAILVGEGHPSPAREVARGMGIQIMEVAEGEGTGSFSIVGLEGDHPEPPLVEGGDDAFLLQTSGTTAAPKLVPLTQSNICHTAFYIGQAMELGERDRCLNVMPLFHGLGLVSLLSTLLTGGSIVCAPSFVPGSFFGWLEALKPTWYTAVPPVHQYVLDMAATRRERAAGTSLRFIRSAAAPLPPKLMQGLEECFRVPVLEAYGMTEAFIIGSNPQPPRKRKAGSVGVASGPEVGIVDQTGNFLRGGETGEIVVRGPNVMRGYEDDPEENARAFINGWMRTGDLGHIDGEGYIFIDGRVKEVINRGGEKVSPNEVDDVFGLHPAVSEAATFAMPHEVLGEDVATAVVLKGGAKGSEEDLRFFASERLTPYKVPSRIFFVKELPKGPSGKILRRRLPELLGVGSAMTHSRGGGAGGASIAASETPLAAAGPSSAEEEEIAEWNSTSSPYPRELCINQIFEGVAEAQPSRMALKQGGSELTYGELNARANRLARLLRMEGVAPGDMVCVCMERSYELVVSILAVLKAGAAYVPIDPSQPSKRISLQISESGSKFALTKQIYEGKLPRGAKTRSFQRAMVEASGLDPGNLCIEVPAGSPACILYVSGPAGRPKGVCVPHRAISQLVLNTNYVSIGADDTIVHQALPGSGLANWEIWGALLNGARLVLAQVGDLMSPKGFAKVLRDEGVTVLGLTTPFFNLYAEEEPAAFKSLKTVIFSGEAADPVAIRRVLEGGPPQRLVNAYGSTETTTFSTWHLITRPPEPDSPVPIGIPVSNATAHVLDGRLRHCRIGSVGELCIGGDGVSLGYLNRPEESERAFISDPFAPGGTLYRTGDLARLRPDGSLELSGRLDSQVKIHGFRVELGEVEAALSACPGVKACAVSSVAGRATAERRLVAYIVPNGSGIPSTPELQSLLMESLPDYMVPSFFVELEEIPRTAAGEVDRRRLPPPDMTMKEGKGMPPGAWDETERRLIGIWEEEMGIRGIKPWDNFYQMGGYSLMAVRIFGRMEESFGVRLPLSMLYRKPTVAQIANELRKAQSSSLKSLVSLRAEGERPVLFLIHAIDGEVYNYGHLVRALGEDQPVYGLRAVGLHEEAPLPSTVEEMARDYIREVKTVRPRGPYHIAGWCGGAYIAFEMAQQLREMGEEVGLVGVLDFEAPTGGKRQSPRILRGLLSKEFFYLGADVRRRARDSRIGNIRLLPRIINMEKLLMRAAGMIRTDEVVLPGESVLLPETWKRVIMNQLRAMQRYRPRRYDGVLTVLKREPLPTISSPDPADGWGGYARRVFVAQINGRFHADMIRPPHVANTAKRLRERIDFHERRG